MPVPLRRCLPALYIACAVLATPAAALDEALATGDMAKLSILEAPRPAPDAAFTRPDGSEGTLADYVGEVAVVNFWATWCGPCRAEMPSLQALQDALGNEGLEVVTIAFGRHNPAAMERFWESTGVDTLPLLLDADTDLAEALGVQGLPHTVILDRAGRVVAELRGEADWASDDALAAMRALLEEE
jgi:thiol-disulfide isomerase/thioredoxin